MIEALPVTEDRKEFLRNLLTDFIERNTTPNWCLLCGGRTASDPVHTRQDCPIEIAEDIYNDLTERG